MASESFLGREQGKRWERKEEEGPKSSDTVTTQAFLNCSAEEDSWESFEQQGNQP